MEFAIWFVFVVAAVALVVFTVEILIPKTIIGLGKKDVWWSPFVVLPPPGEMYIIVRGTSSGPFHSVVESVLDYKFNSGTHEFEGPENTTPKKEDYLSKLGVAWIGFWRYRFYREVRHDKWEMVMDDKNKPTGKWGIVSKVRPGPSIYFRYNMAVEIKGAETVGNFPVDAVIVFTAQIVNPVKAFFFAGGWETQTTAAVAGAFRKYVSNKTIDELRTEHKTGESTSIVEEVKKLGGRNSNGNHDPSGLFALFGIEITDARFVLFDLVSGDAAMTNATRALEIAKLEAEADKQRGIGAKERRTEEAHGIAATVKAWGSNEVGAQVAIAEAIKEAKPSVLGGNIVASVDSKRGE